MGIVLSICGLDGSGKSTAVENVGCLMKKNFDYKLIHLGRPDPTLLILPFWFAFRLAEKVRHKEKSAERSVDSFLPNPNVTLLAAIRYCIIAIERKAAAIKAHAYSKNGYIVITDRYPSLEYGKMDSPRITKNKKRSCFYRFLHNVERHCYDAIPACDISMKLSIPVETAVYRNSIRVKAGKETANEIRARYLVNSDFKAKTLEHIDIDASQSIDAVRDEIVNLIFKKLDS